jgi:replication factor A1
LNINELDLAPHIEDIKRALGNEITEEKIVEELKKYFEYGVGPIEAKKAVVKKLGGDFSALFKPTFRSLADVQTTDKNIDLKVKVLSVNPKTVTVQGAEKEIHYGLFADTTMVRPFTAWNDFELEKNNVIHIHSAYAKDWRGEPQINLGNNTSVEPLDDAKLIALDTSSLPTTLPSNESNIGSLRDGFSNITVTGRILSVEPRTVTVLGEQKEIYTGILADESGKISFTAWSDFKLEQGEVIKVIGAYIRSWRGVPKLNFDERMELSRLPSDSILSLDKLTIDKVMRIDKLIEIGGAMDVTIEGTILDIKEGSGLIMRCEECNRVLRNGECMVHGVQSGVPDLRVKAVVDDGAGAIIVVLNAELTANILSKTVEECTEKAKEVGPEYLETIFNELHNTLLLHPMRFNGTVTTDEFGSMMIARKIDDVILTEEIPLKVKELIENLNSNSTRLEAD